MSRMQKTLRERLDEKWIPEPNSGCWLWTGAADRHGYGRMSVKRDGRWRQLGAHQVSWETYRGERGGLCVLHRCDNPACVNPDHLFLGTMSDNSRDMVRKGRNGAVTKPGSMKGNRGWPERCPDRWLATRPRGERNGHAKLTWDQVCEIRRLHTERRLSQRKMAAMFSVSKGSIQQIVEGRCWNQKGTQAG